MPIDRHRDPFDTAWRTEAILIRRRLIRLQDETRDLRRALARKYDPNQPRVPAGDPHGGQWTDGSGGGGGGGGSVMDLGLGQGLGDFGNLFGPAAGLVPAVDPTGDPAGSDPWSSYTEDLHDDGSLASTDVSHRDGSRIQSEYAKPDEASDWDERHTVTLPAGEKVTFETSGRTQTIREGGPGGEVMSRSTWEQSGPEPEARVQQAFAPAVVVAPAVVAAGTVLFGWLSQQNRPGGQQAVMAFTPRDYQPSQNLGKVDLNFVGTLSKEEAEQACRYMPQSQEFANRAARAAGHSNQYPSMQAYGTNVHTRFKDFVEDLFNPDYRAERSFLKEGAGRGNPGEVPYGTRDSVRVDAYEYNRMTRTLCVYDLKTGGAELSGPRADILANAIKFGFIDVRRIILIEVRPDV